MNKIRVSTKNAYNIIIGKKLLQNSGEIISQNFSSKTFVIISDDIVWNLYGDILANSLKSNDINCFNFVFKNGEASKNLSTANKIYDFLSSINFTRDDILIALGGGVVGDISGFIASTYLRGVKYIQIPTTFLAQIDSSVGGKTAVNIENGKNLVGTFWQPAMVICDISTLDTLSDEIFSDGTAEAIKYGAIYDKEIFELIANDIRLHLERIIIRCITIKRDVVEKDELDENLRMILNFGHTLGHTIEIHSNFKLTHGKAISIGMCIMCKYGEQYGLTKKGTFELLSHTLRKNNLPITYEADLAKLIDIAANDKKCAGNDINFIVLEQIGKASIVRLPFTQFKQNILEII